MRVPKLFGGLLLVASVAACGGGTPTQAPAGATQNPVATSDGGGGGATEAPDATQSGGGGGGGGGDTTYGKVHIEITGPVTKTADYGFLPGGSMFGGDQGSVLNFSAGEGTNEVVSILITPNQPVVVSYSGTDFQAAGATCTTSNWNISGTSGSGDFECDAPLIILIASGGTATGGKIKGNFTAHM